MLRYLFLCPDRESASGGIAVIHQIAGRLKALGYETAILQQSAGFRSPLADPGVPTFYTKAYQNARLDHVGIVKKAGLIVERVQKWGQKGLNPEIVPGPDDILVVPEYMYSIALDAFPDTRKIVFSQNSFSYITACGRAILRGHDPVSEAVYNVSSADICRKAFEVVGASPIANIPASPQPEQFSFAQGKERLITYMPRKRPDEAELVARALHRRGNLHDYDLVAIDGMAPEQVRELLERSRFFLSFMRSESLGFPAAEAMASGCVVIGYTGLGAMEYFDETTGIPVAEGDTSALVDAVEKAVSEYETDPARLDAIRRAGCDRVHERYSTEVFEAALAREWPKIDARCLEASRKHDSAPQ